MTTVGAWASVCLKSSPGDFNRQPWLKSTDAVRLSHVTVCLKRFRSQNFWACCLAYRNTSSPRKLKVAMFYFWLPSVHWDVLCVPVAVSSTLTFCNPAEQSVFFFRPVPQILKHYVCIQSLLPAAVLQMAHGFRVSWASVHQCPSHRSLLGVIYWEA